MRRALLLLVAPVAIAAGVAWHVWQRPGPLAAETAVVVPRGGTDAIAEALRRAGAIEDARFFAVATLATRGQGPLRAGEFVLPAGASLAVVLDTLRHARPVQRLVTIPEGFSARQIAAALDRAEGLTGDTPAIAEGALLPETYAYSWGETRAAVVRRAEAAMATALTETWAQRDPNAPVANPREALVLASIIERETARPEERARIAGVFANRLRRGMPLQSDPTVIYAVAAGAPFERALTRADLDREHPFNTYRARGLPPGPIAAPGRAALLAAVRPEATEALYFVADGGGGHAFAATLEEHNRNVARWRAGRAP